MAGYHLYMQDVVTRVLPKFSWGPIREVQQRVVHFYAVNRSTHQMYCVNCNKNIINTQYGDAAYLVGSKELQENEVLCEY